MPFVIKSHDSYYITGDYIFKNSLSLFSSIVIANYIFYLKALQDKCFIVSIIEGNCCVITKPYYYHSVHVAMQHNKDVHSPSVAQGQLEELSLDRPIHVIPTCSFAFSVLLSPKLKPAYPDK